MTSLEHLANKSRFMALRLPHWQAERAIRIDRPRAGGRLNGKPDGLRAPGGGPAGAVGGTHKGKGKLAGRLSGRPPPLAITRFERNARRLAGVCPRAAEMGLAPGMMLTEARALVPELTFCDEAPRDDARALEALALWCRRYAPHTAIRDPHAVMIDITGATHLFGGEKAMLGDVLARLSGLGYTVLGAIADTGPGALALTHDHHRYISAPGTMAEDLAPSSVAALGLGETAVSALNILGLRSIGDLQRVPRASLVPRLGLAAMARLDEALGNRAAPLSPLTETIPARAFRRFFDPLERPQDILACLGGLADAVAVANVEELDEEAGSRRPWLVGSVCAGALALGMLL